MDVNIIKIGNSKGIRLSNAIIKQYGFKKIAHLEFKANKITIEPADETPRAGWDAEFKKLNTDSQVDSNDWDFKGANDWDNEGWEW